MSEDNSGLSVRQAPRKRTDNAQVVDFTLMVTVPGQPEAIRVFTASEESEAHRYATDTGGTVVPLPLPPPDGYTAGPDGHLIPQPTVACASTADFARPIDADEAED
ncbi:hypothetical protein QN239_31645 [Mycolicibacterium sp. Y3]